MEGGGTRLILMKLQKTAQPVTILFVCIRFNVEMAAGTEQLPKTRCLPGNPTLVPITEYGPEYLAGSHFTIAQDPEATRPSLKSVFKRDYPAWEILSKPPGAIPPKPADVLQTDFRYFNDKASETRIQYEYRPAPKRELQADRDKLRATNFKMDRDLRFNSFQTTHARDYVPMRSDTVVQRRQNDQKSYIPQGDPEKADDPMSDYKDRYRGIDAVQHRPEIASNKHFGMFHFAFVCVVFFCEVLY